MVEKNKERNLKANTTSGTNMFAEMSPFYEGDFLPAFGFESWLGKRV